MHRVAKENAALSIGITFLIPFSSVNFFMPSSVRAVDFNAEALERRFRFSRALLLPFYSTILQASYLRKLLPVAPLGLWRVCIRCFYTPVGSLSHSLFTRLIPAGAM